MSSQYLPHQQFGGPPQNFPPNRSSPQPGTNFQNITTGVPKQGQLSGGMPPMQVPPPGPIGGNVLSPSAATPPTGQQFPSNIPQNPNIGSRLPIPPNQLPPSQDQRNTNTPQSNTFGHSKPNALDSSNLQNGPSQFSNYQNESGVNQSKPQQSLDHNLQNLNLTPFSEAGVASQNMPLLPGAGLNPSNQFLQSGNTQNQFSNTNQPPKQYSVPPTSNQFNQPPTQNLPVGPPRPGQPIQASLQHGQSSQGSNPPLLPGQPPNVYSIPGQLPGNQSSLPGQPSNQPPQFMPGQRPLQRQQPMPGQPPIPGQHTMSGLPPVPSQQPTPGLPPLPGQPPVSNQSLNQPPMPSHPPLPGQGPPRQFSNQFPSGPHAPAPAAPASFNGTNQIINQIQGMNLDSGPRQYTNGSMKSPGTLDRGPHMPPPVNQSYINGQQNRTPQVPGYPPMPGQGMPGQGLPGQGAMPPGIPGGYPQPNYQQQQQQNRRLDPDQMPSPIQVTQDDQQNRSGVFVTNQKGLVPPLVTTKFVVQDQGNASPRYIRSTMYNVPISQDIIKQTAVPFSLVISPMARTIEEEYPPPIVNFGELGPIRCVRCKAYMCPYMQFIDSGRRFQCLFCRVTTDVPAEYFQHLDHTGQRMDRYERPELILGTYEFVATADYCRNNTLPKPPAIIFVLDVSYNNVKSGLVNLLCSQMKDIIQNLPVDQGQEKSNMRVGFITYNNSVHFYNIKGTLAAPQMMVVGDVQEMFMPLLDGFLCTPEESGPIIDALMQQIPTMFGDTRETETVLLPAIQAGLEALKASECNGKLLVFHSTLPTAEAPGKLKNRDDRKLLGTEKEKTVLVPQTQAYNQLGQDCVAVGCSVDLFIFNNAYIDLATIGQVARLTGGEIFKYTYFQADIDGERLINDIITDISRPIAFDAVMRVRTSTGVRPTDFYGHFYMSNTTDMELAAIDCDKAVAVEIKYDDKLSEEEGVYIQVALLYTSCSGQRRLRIINLSLKTCSQMADLYRSCDLDTIINYISKQAVYKLLENNPKVVKDSIVNRAAQMLATYRKNCASPSSAGQLILPECMKLLPLYVNCLLKSDAISGGSDMTIDDRSFVMQAVMTMDIPTSVNYFYPRLIPLHDLDTSKTPVEVPSPIRCTIEKMSEQGVYILENGIHMFLWFGLAVSPDFVQNVFGAPSAIQVDIDRIGLPELDNPLSLAVRSIIETIRQQRHRYMRLTIVRQREKLEPVFKHFLVEDRGNDGSPSYVDFLCHMHKEIRALLS